MSKSIAHVMIQQILSNTKPHDIFAKVSFFDHHPSFPPLCQHFILKNTFLLGRNFIDIRDDRE